MRDALSHLPGAVFELIVLAAFLIILGVVL